MTKTGARSRFPIVPLARNFTVPGSIANLIVVQNAAASGVQISFWDYFRVGAPVTGPTIVIWVLWLWL